VASPLPAWVRGAPLAFDLSLHFLMSVPVVLFVMYPLVATGLMVLAAVAANRSRGPGLTGRNSQRSVAHSRERVSAGRSQFGRYGSFHIQMTKQMPQTSTLPMTAATTMRVSLCTLESLEISCRDVFEGRVSVKF